MFTFAFGLTTAEIDPLNSFDSMAQSETLGDVTVAFESCESCPLRQRLDAALNAAGSKLNADVVIRRIRTQTCAGCHSYSNPDEELEIDCPDGWSKHGFCDGEGSDRHGIWPDTLGGAPDSLTSAKTVQARTVPTPRWLISPGTITLEKLRNIRSERIPHL